MCGRPAVFALAVASLLSQRAWGDPPSPAPPAAEEPVQAAASGVALCAAGWRPQATPAGRPYHARRTAHFEWVSCMDEASADQAARVLEILYRQFHEAFEQAGLPAKEGQGRLTWICFAERKEFEGYAQGADRMDMSWSDGYYSARTNRVVLPQDMFPPAERPAPAAIVPAVLHGAGGARREPPGGAGPAPAAADLTSIRHESAHQLAFNCGFQKRGVMYPLWLSEGLATSLEADVAGPSRVIRDNPLRLEHLLDARAANRLMPLSELAILTRLPAAGRYSTEDLYAQFWALFRFLLEHRRDELKGYLVALAALEPGPRDPLTLRREFAASFGRLELLERPWSAYVRALAEPAPLPATAAP